MPIQNTAIEIRAQYAAAVVHASVNWRENPTAGFAQVQECQAMARQLGFDCAASGGDLEAPAFFADKPSLRKGWKQGISDYVLGS
jgi:hypothetical protein